MPPGVPLTAELQRPAGRNGSGATLFRTPSLAGAAGPGSGVQPREWGPGQRHLAVASCGTPVPFSCPPPAGAARDPERAGMLSERSSSARVSLPGALGYRGPYRQQGCSVPARARRPLTHCRWAGAAPSIRSRAADPCSHPAEEGEDRYLLPGAAPRSPCIPGSGCGRTLPGPGFLPGAERDCPAGRGSFCSAPRTAPGPPPGPGARGPKPPQSHRASLRPAPPSVPTLGSWRGQPAGARVLGTPSPLAPERAQRAPPSPPPGCFLVPSSPSGAESSLAAVSLLTVLDRDAEGGRGMLPPKRGGDLIIPLRVHLGAPRAARAGPPTLQGAGPCPRLVVPHVGG